MASFIWNRVPQEAMDNPYEYEAQEQFHREAQNLLNNVTSKLKKLDMSFTRNDQSLEKAIWILHNDALDSLKDILDSLSTKKHRIAGKLFRDIFETLDIAALFHSNTDRSKKLLSEWYNDEIISHSKFRDYIKKEKGEELALKIRDSYRIISKFSHRTYKILLYGYVLGRDDLIAYDGYRKPESLALPQTIAMYYAILADYIKLFLDELLKRGSVTKLEKVKIWKSSMEKKPVPRRFVPRKYSHGKEKQ